MGTTGERQGAAQRPQPRRADLGPLQPRRRGRSRRRPLGLVAGRLPARDDAQPGRRPVGRAALDAAARRQLAAVRPLLAGRRRHVLRRGRRRLAPDAAGLRRPARSDPAELRLRPRRLLQPGAGRRAPTWRRTGTPTTRRSSRPAARSPRPAAAARCGCRSRPPRPPAPSVAGTPRRGSTLTARVGAWNNAPTGYTYQWQRLVAAGWEDIDGATAATYVASSEDLGRRLRVTVVATNQDGSSSAASPRPPRSAPPASTAPRRPRARARSRQVVGQGQHERQEERRPRKKKAAAKQEGRAPRRRPRRTRR